jgi:PHP family Zn ribbon phosphoesterase
VLSLHLKLDLHIHTISSQGVLIDSAETIEKILDIAKEKGLDGLFLTDYSARDVNKSVSVYHASTCYTRA